MHICFCLTLTWICVWAEPGWAGPGWWAGCDYPSRQQRNIWETGWQRRWRRCSPVSADDAGTQPRETWTRSHRPGPEVEDAPRPLHRRPPAAARTQTCCPGPRWWGTGTPGCWPGKGETARRRVSRRCRCRQRGGGPGWWSGTTVSKGSKGNRHKWVDVREKCVCVF